MKGYSGSKENCLEVRANELLLKDEAKDYTISPNRYVILY